MLGTKEMYFNPSHSFPANGGLFLANGGDDSFILLIVGHYHYGCVSQTGFHLPKPLEYNPIVLYDAAEKP